jgi:hypothetical protein
VGAVAKIVATMNSVSAGNLDAAATVNGFWRDVWQARNPEAVDQYVVDDFIITSGGKDIYSREEFKKWIASFQFKVGDLKLEILETFATADGKRVVSRLRLTGTNNGIFGLVPDNRPFSMTASAIWAAREDGKLEHNWVERNAWEVYSELAKNQ